MCVCVCVCARVGLCVLRNFEGTYMIRDHMNISTHDQTELVNIITLCNKELLHGLTPAHAHGGGEGVEYGVVLILR